MDMYLVGGAVRDLLRGEMPRDFDWAFAGTPEDFVQAYPKARKVIPGKEVYWLDNMEFSQLRGTIEEDLALRDFTVNSLILESSGILHCHPLALRDIKERVLRPAGARSLPDDPVRVFRAARFAAQYPDFTIAPETPAQMRAAAPLLDSIAAEQVGKELWKALAGQKSSRFLYLLAETGCLTPWFAELGQAAAVSAGPLPWHTGPVLDHLAAVLDFCAGLDAASPLLAWMALCHDLGKITTDPEILPHHYGHEARGVQLAENLGQRLKLPKKAIEAGMLASRLHMKAAQYEKLRPGTRVDLLIDAHAKGLVDELFTLAFADTYSLATAEIPQKNHLLSTARADLAQILAVRLPQELQNNGPASGAKLRELRCRALSPQ